MAEVAFENKIEDLEHIAIFGFDGNFEKKFSFPIPMFISDCIFLFNFLPIKLCIGTKPGALKLHGNHLIFPLGRKISILNIDNNKQEFLCGHTNTVSAIAVSKW